MKIALLCGGKGTRLIEKTEYIPKPLAEIGNIPIITHLMLRYLHFGYNKFVLLIGYKGKKITEYFEAEKKKKFKDINLLSHVGHSPKFLPKPEYLDTGQETAMWRRLLLARGNLTDKTFMVNYSDGLADIDIKKVLTFHRKHKKIGTVVIVKPHSQYGKVVINKSDDVKTFIEKPVQSFWVNGGFFVFNKKFFKYLEDGLEKNIQPLELLAKAGELKAYKHSGFWKCMDTFKDLNEFNEFYLKGEAKWLKFK
ncbi:glucose-1-phosphate cytidylyltransferase [Candidatus Dependentiae bacterium]|nr:glucose-1-phosphate cytidylyltransferase [Candidatus Dependentiae bacterium]